MSNTIWAVDGSFFAQRLSGIQRYSIELLAALDGAGLTPELSVAPRDTVGPCHIVRRRALCKR